MKIYLVMAINYCECDTLCNCPSAYVESYWLDYDKAKEHAKKIWQAEVTEEETRD